MIDEDDIENTAYESMLKHLNSRSENDDFDIEQIRSELKTLEKYEGLDWTGRGSIKAAEISGHILAYQVFLMRYRKKAQ